MSDPTPEELMARAKARVEAYRELRRHTLAVESAAWDLAMRAADAAADARAKRGTREWADAYKEAWE